MKKRGFTLIELLAVIVILAIIVLIAAPVVVDIIGDSKKDGIINGASLYLKAVDLAIAEKNKEEGLMPEGTFKLDAKGNVCFDENCENKLVVKTTGNIPKGGVITIENSSVTGIEFEYDGATVVLNDRGVPEFDGGVICKLASGTEKQTGSKYECKVKAGTKYNFYLLGIDGNGVATMIMDKNIVEDVHWLNKTDFMSAGGSDLSNDGMGCQNGPRVCANAAYGPITAMDALHNATKDWENVLPVTINYTHSNGAPYTIITDSGVTTIKRPDGVATKTYTSLKATMLSKSEFDSYKSSVPEIVDGNTYWTLSGSDYSANNSKGSTYITYDSEVCDATGFDCSVVGIRPVIQVKL